MVRVQRWIPPLYVNIVIVLEANKCASNRNACYRWKDVLQPMKIQAVAQFTTTVQIYIKLPVVPPVQLQQL